LWIVKQLILHGKIELIFSGEKFGNIANWSNRTRIEGYFARVVLALFA
jgi:hypothetical protein